MHPVLSDEEILRYDRQITLRGFDFSGQEQLKNSRVLIIGLGGLGCAATPWLASGGIGQLTLVDFDTVSLSNLQRQILHDDMHIDQPKVLSAKQQLSRINPFVRIDTVDTRCSDAELSELVLRHHLVLDCSDNVTTREQINRLCFQHKIPLISGAVVRMEGQIIVFDWQEKMPCYRCISRLFSATPLSCAETGVMSPLPGVIGALQAMEAIRLLTNYGERIGGKMVIYDAMTLQFRELALHKDPGCEVCGPGH